MATDWGAFIGGAVLGVPGAFAGSAIGGNDPFENPWSTLGSGLGGAGGGFLGSAIGGKIGGSLSGEAKNDMYQSIFQPVPYPQFGGPAATGYAPGQSAGQLALQNQLNTQGLERYRQEALRQGPSRFAGLEQERARQEQLGQEQAATAQAAAGEAQARDALAARGGLTSGAAERIAQGGAQSRFAGQQAAQAQGIQRRGEIASQDEAARIQQLQNLPQMEYQALQGQLSRYEPLLRQQLLGSELAQREAQSKRDFELKKYAIENERRAAQELANAQRWTSQNTGGLFGGGGFLGLGL